MFEREQDWSRRHRLNTTFTVCGQANATWKGKKKLVIFQDWIFNLKLNQTASLRRYSICVWQPWCCCEVCVSLLCKWVCPGTAVIVSGNREEGEVLGETSDSNFHSLCVSFEEPWASIWLLYIDSHSICILTGYLAAAAAAVVFTHACDQMRKEVTVNSSSFGINICFKRVCFKALSESWITIRSFNSRQPRRVVANWFVNSPTTLGVSFLSDCLFYAFFFSILVEQLWCGDSDMTCRVVSKNINLFNVGFMSVVLFD